MLRILMCEATKFWMTRSDIQHLMSYIDLQITKEVLDLSVDECYMENTEKIL